MQAHREIGVMKVLGCEIDDLAQCSDGKIPCIGFIGGVLGVLISLLVG